MKISVNDQELFTLTETQKKVIQNDIPCECFEEDMKRRLYWVLVEEKYRKCFDRLKKEWEPKLIEARYDSLPTNPDEFAELVFSQPGYKNRSAKEAELKEAALKEAELIKNDSNFMT